MFLENLWLRYFLMILPINNGWYVFLTLSLPVPRLEGDNTDLPSDINIWKTVRVNIAFSGRFSKEYSISFLMVCRLIDSALAVLELSMFKVCGIIGISKIKFFNFSGNERVNKVRIKVFYVIKKRIPIVTNSEWLIYQTLN